MQWFHIIGPVLVGVGAGVFLMELILPAGVFGSEVFGGLFFRFSMLFAIGFMLIVISGHYLLLVPNGITNWQALSMGIHTKYAKLVLLKIAFALGVVSFKVFVVFAGVPFPPQLFFYVIFAAIVNIALGTTLRRNAAALMK
jgi:hypothetical protein